MSYTWEQLRDAFLQERNIRHTLQEQVTSLIDKVNILEGTVASKEKVEKSLIKSRDNLNDRLVGLIQGQDFKSHQKKYLSESHDKFQGRFEGLFEDVKKFTRRFDAPLDKFDFKGLDQLADKLQQVLFPDADFTKLPRLTRLTYLVQAAVKDILVREVIMDPVHGCDSGFRKTFNNSVYNEIHHGKSRKRRLDLRD